MKVKFANAEIELWRLRRGVVVGFTDDFDNFQVGHISWITLLREEFDLYLEGGLYSTPNLFRGKDIEKLIWLEPHD